MSAARFLLRSLTFYWRAHLSVFLGVLVSSSILIGALAVGDSIRHSLRRMALERLGDTEIALASPNRFFREALALDLARRLDASVAPLLIVRGIVARGDGVARANAVQIVGLDEKFFSTAGGAPFPLKDGGVVVNERLARQLDLRPGESVVLRIEKPGRLPGEAVLAQINELSTAARLEVSGTAGAGELGRFGLQASQIEPFNAFVPLRWLQENLERAGRANLLLVRGASAEEATQALREVWQLADAGLEVRDVGGTPELCSERIFLEQPVIDAALRAEPASLRVLTYFVNEIAHGDRSAPYSMVAALGGAVPEPIPSDLGPREIVLNSWLAEDLRAAPGNQLTLRYFVPDARGGLAEESAAFEVRAIVPMEGAAADRELMPDFPGIAEAERSRDWTPGIPIDLGRIRDRDEDYWEKYRGTPKAFVALETGQKLWSNRFGALTAIRFPEVESGEDLAGRIRRHLDPASVELSFIPVREQALKAVGESLDFGQLFLGFSFFLIVAALLLTGLLFAFGVEQRTEQTGTLLALGLRPTRVRAWLLIEGLVIAAAGSVCGVIGGVVYTRLMLRGLATSWRDAVAGTSGLQFHVEPVTLVIGVVAGVGAALIAIWFVVRRQARRPPRELLALGLATAEDSHPEAARRRVRKGLVTGTAAVVLAAVVAAVFGPGAEGQAAAGIFFGAGFLLLIGALGFGHAALARATAATSEAARSLPALALRNAGRRPGRSLATLSLLACGSFMIVAVAANRRDPLEASADRSSGTGGFTFIGETTLPVLRDLDSERGREMYGLSGAEGALAKFVACRVREGDDASCLNLTRSQTPRLLGVDPEELATRGAFTFVKQTNNGGWRALLDRPEKELVPAIADENTLAWGLGKGVGDTLTFLDEAGRPFRIVIVGTVASSILQGSLIIAEDAFIEKFPSESGYRLFLIDVPPAHAEEVAAVLRRSLEDEGMVLQPARERLALYTAVQNAYLSVFTALGGLGLLLGSAGLGIMVLRNVLERRSELALMRTVGFPRSRLRQMVFGEHALLLALGLLCGMVASLLALWPAIGTPGAEIPWPMLLLTLLLVCASGLLWTWLAASFAVRGELLSALRKE